jgi:Carboxypeptidase regulatory-like domain
MRTTLLVFVASSLLGACVATVRPSGPPPPPPPARESRPPERVPEPRVIEGTVRDAITHQPIDRAAIDITSPALPHEMAVQTCPDGRYRTTEIPPGEFGLRARREGYEVVQQRATMSDGTAHVDFDLVPKHR